MLLIHYKNVLLCWALIIVWSIVDTYDISGGGSASAFTLFFCYMGGFLLLFLCIFILLLSLEAADGIEKIYINKKQNSQSLNIMTGCRLKMGIMPISETSCISDIAQNGKYCNQHVWKNIHGVIYKKFESFKFWGMDMEGNRRLRFLWTPARCQAGMSRGARR